jgi:hypothetical protein
LHLSTYYTDEEWTQAVAGRPMAEISDERFMTLHRHWIWANSAFRWFERELPKPRSRSDGIDLTSDRSFSMYLWYSLLWAVIEGVQKHRIIIQGAFLEDVRKVREPLREARNAIMHVSEDAYFDRRLFLIMDQPESAGRVWRVHKGYARLFYEELQAAVFLSL